LGARTSPFARNWTVHDYAAIAPLVDRLRIMTYDYHSPGSTPGPVAPLWWVEAVASYALTVAPAGKVELGVPLYGYDWPADSRRWSGWGTASSLTYLKAEALRAHYHAKRQWSSVDAAPWFTYTTRAGVRHVVWYNDAASTRAKLGLVVNYHLRGLAFWVVGSEDARQWPAIRAFTGPPAAAHPKRPARGH
ncbi:MAG TPA: glycosyl hydrolase family 18 protein, partial [Actinomycetota bacterium]